LESLFVITIQLPLVIRLHKKGSIHNRKATTTVMERFLRNPEILLKVQLLTAVARNANRGDSFFMQVSPCPVTSIRITTGDVDPDDEQQRNTHIHFTGEPDGYPTWPPDMATAQRRGYEKYLRRLHTNFRENPEEGFSPISIDLYRDKFMRICRKFDAAVYTDHGVKCYINGNMEDDYYFNVIIFHLCDIMTIFIHERQGLPIPDLVLQTDMLTTIPSQEMVSDLMDVQMSVEEKNFLEEHIDWFYLCYAYWGNFSFVPIRSRMSNNVNDVEEASFLMTTNNNFIEHQRGKLEELNRNNPATESRMLYRSM
jgi:hypothetical protein